MTEEYRWTDEADRRARALIERMAARTDSHRDYADARGIVSAIKVDPVEELVKYLTDGSWSKLGVRTVREAILAGIELGKKDQPQ